MILLLASGPLAAVTLAGCGSSHRHAAVPVLVDRTADQISRIVAVARDGRRAELTHDGQGTWTAQPRMAPETAVLMFEAQGQLFPLRAYRRVRADASDPQFGLTDPEITLSVTDGGGRAQELLLGGPTFNGAGFYARRPGESMLYLVPRGVMNDLRSLVQGQAVSSPHQVEEKLDQIAARAQRAQEEPDSWLRQATEAGAVVPEGLKK
jgi:hypothetical protein